VAFLLWPELAHSSLVSPLYTLRQEDKVAAYL
jgi:hypothetical protein